MEKLKESIKATATLRMSLKDAHYGGSLVDGAQLVHLVGDVATELSIIYDGDEGLLLRYNHIEFLAPVHAGDYIRVDGELTEVGHTSRKMVFAAYKTASPKPEISDSAVDHLEEPVQVLSAELIGVTKKELQRVKHEEKGLSQN